MGSEERRKGIARNEEDKIAQKKTTVRKKEKKSRGRMSHGQRSEEDKSARNRTRSRRR